jgi:RHS repeat-associated protein
MAFNNPSVWVSLVFSLAFAPSLLSQSNPNYITVDVNQYWGAASINGVSKGKTNLVPGKEYTVELEPNPGETSMLTIGAVCNANIIVKEVAVDYNEDGPTGPVEPLTYNSGSGASFQRHKSEVDGGGGPVILDPDPSTPGNVSYTIKTYTIKAEFADTVEETDPTDETNSGSDGSPGYASPPPAARPVFDSTNCCPSALNNSPGFEKIPRSEATNVQSIAEYQFPFGGEFKANQPLSVPSGSLVFKAGLNVNLAESWHLCLRENPLYDSKATEDPLTSSGRGIYITFAYVFETKLVGGTIIISQYKKAYTNNVVNNDLAGIVPLKRYKIQKDVSGEPFYQFGHYEGLATDPYRTDRYYADVTSDSSSVRWEFDNGSRVNKTEKKVIVEPASPENGNVAITKIVRELEELNVLNGVSTPVNYIKTEHEVFKRPYESADYVKLNYSVTGLGENALKELYSYDVHNPHFVVISRYAKADTINEYLVSSEAVRGNELRVSSWLNTTVDSLTGIRLSVARFDSGLFGEHSSSETRYIFSNPNGDPYLRYYDGSGGQPSYLKVDKVEVKSHSLITHEFESYGLRPVRQLSRTNQIFGRYTGSGSDSTESPEWRQSVQDFYPERAVNLGGDSIHNNGGISLPGELFRSISRSGLTEEYSKEKPYTPPSGSENDYPLAAKPYFRRIVHSDLLTAIGSTNFNPAETAQKQANISTRRETIRGRHGVASESLHVWTGSSWAEMSMTRYHYSSSGKLISRVKDGDTIESYTYPDAHTEVMTGSDGVVITTIKNDRDEVISQTRQAVPAMGEWDAQPAVVTSSTKTTTAHPSEPNRVKTITSTEILSSAGLTLQSTQTTDVGGATLSNTNQAGVTTTYSSGLISGYPGQTASRANGVHTVTSSNYLDGQRREEAGSGQVRRIYTYEIKTTSPKGIEETETISEGATETVNKRLRTGNGELISETLNGVTTTYAYDVCGRVVSKTTAGPVGNRVYRYQYNFRNLVVREGWDVNGDGNLTAGSTDVIVEHENYYEFADNAWWLVDKRSTYLEDGNSALKQTTTTREKQGTGAGSITQVIYPDATVETTTRSISGKVVTTTVTSDRFPGRTSTQIVYNGRLVSSQDFTQTQPLLYRYDALGRQVRVLDKGAAQVQLTTYDPANGQVKTTKNGANEVTSYDYYPASDPNAGRLRKIQNNAGERTYYAYNLLGQITHQWGNGSQPLRYVYDAAGQLQYLDTFLTQDLSLWAGEALPTAFESTAPGSYARRSFSSDDGRQLGRTYGPGAGGVGYQYNADGSLHQRTWAGTAANRTTTYSYTPAGQLGGIDYSDATPDVILSYDRSGRIKTLLDAGGFRVFNQQANGDVQETVSGGLLDGLTMTKHLNSAGQTESLEWSFAGVSQKASYSYDSQKRLESASLGPVSGDPLVTASYTYHPDTHRVKTLTRPLGEGVPLLGTWTQDVMGRLDTLIWQRGVVTYGGHDYQLDAAGRRRQETRLDGTRLEYAYNTRGELESAVRKRVADGSTRPDWSHEYDYDDSGSRTSSTTPEGETLTHAFGPGPGPAPTASTKHWLRGRANPQATVTVGGQAATRDGEVWRYLLVNPSAPAAQRTTVTAARPDLDPVPTPVTETMTLPADTGSYAFDERGNLTSDSQWVYAWDLENRLVSQEQKFPGISGDGAQPVKRLEFAYDGLSRRISKKVLSNERESDGDLVNANWTFEKETVFLWQDWTLVAEFVRTTSGGSLSLRRGYLWGLDVDGTLGGAGGVGGLLWVADYVPGAAVSNRQLAPWYDGNGNVMGWVENAPAQMLPLHRLEYDPYGKVLVEEDVRVARTKKQRDQGVTAEWLDRPAFGFSTKYEDVETGLSYYGYRYYGPEMGRWLSRDPIGERGGLNLHGMVGNDSVNEVDYLGLDKVVISGGTSVNDPNRHDLSGWNFLNTAVRRAKALEADLKKKGKKEEVVLIVYAPPYERRAIAEKKPSNYYLDIVRKAISGTGVKIVEIRKKDDLTKELVKFPSGSITSLDYFGHSSKDYLLLEYSSTPQTNGTHDGGGNLLPTPGKPTSNDFWGGTDTKNHDANNVPKTQFALGATVASYGCHQGEKGGFSEMVNKIWGVASQGSDGRTDYGKAGAGGGPPFPSSANGYITYP